jgi:glutamate/tyrosine decarboxylase-like PLP-dependent enzyme
MNYFIHPDGKNLPEIKPIIERVTNVLLDHLTASEQRSPLDPLEFNIPATGRTVDSILEDLKTILQGSLNPSNPHYIGHMDSIPTLMSSLGEFISSSLNNNMLSLEMSPVFSKMEAELTSQISQLFGLGPESGGVMVSGGTLANLQALCVARNHTFKTTYSLPGQPVIYASDSAHTSLQKAAMILGLGSSAVTPIKTNQNARMDVTLLEKKIVLDLREGKVPFTVVATAGTTVTGNIDPLPEIARLAKKYKLWLHVDAAYGGSLAFTSRYRHKLAGIEEADSVTFNPQKWMYIAKTSAMVLFKNKQLLQQDFRISAPYMNETDFVNLGEISIQGTRHADVLKLWLSLQHIGREGYESLISHSFELVDVFTEQVRKRPFLELAAEPDTNICCFRGIPANRDWDNWNLGLQQYLLQEDQTFVSLPTFRGNRWLRAVLLNPFTSVAMIEELFRKIDYYYRNY